MKTKFTVLLIFSLLALPGLQAQNNSVDEQVYQSLKGHGSMNVVFTVVGVILIGIFITLWRIDKKVSKLEKEINEKKS